MAESAGTFDSADSSAAKRSPPASSAAEVPPTTPASSAAEVPPTTRTSSGADVPPTTRGPSGADAPAVDAAAHAQLRVDFYILEEASPTARLRLGCKLAEKAYLSGQRALVRLGDPDELRSFDELLWTFMDGSFVPHDVLGSSTRAEDVPVLLSVGGVPAGMFDIIINLAAEIPDCLAQTRRVAEIVDGDAARRRAGRTRFKAYRDRGAQPASHNIRAE